MTHPPSSVVRGAMCGAIAVALFGLSPIVAQQPRFRTSVDVISVDVVVVDDRGQPITNLQPGDFAVRIDGAPRPVVSAEWVSLRNTEAPRQTFVPDGYSSNEHSTGGRLIIIAVDVANIRFGATAGMSRTLGGFVDRLEASDRIAAVAVGQSSGSTAFTSDRRLVKEALARMTGVTRQRNGLSYNISLTEAVDIERGQPAALERVAARECAGLQGFELGLCRQRVEADAHLFAKDALLNGSEALLSLRALLNALADIDAPKTLILVSDGFLLNDRNEAYDVGALAAAARTSLYILKLDDQIIEAGDSRALVAPTEDRNKRFEALELIATASRGAVFTIVGASMGAFQRLEGELAGYYLIALETDVRDRDGRQHSLDVQVSRRGAHVRTRRQLPVVVPPIRRNPRDAAVFALRSPLLAPALPLRVVTFSLRGSETSKIQLLIHVDAGADYSSPKPVSVAYMISDRGGRIIDSQVAEGRLPPIMPGVPSPLQFTAGASLDPGEYTLKLAMAEGDRVGTVEHAITARLVDAPALKLSELMVGGPATAGELLQPTIGYRVMFGMVHGYVEAYGAGASQVKVKYEVASEPDAPALLDADVAGRPAGEERSIFTHSIPVRQLPPGKYYLRAVVATAAGVAKTLARPFEVARPDVLMTSAQAGARAIAPSDIFLPVTDTALARPFRRQEVARGDTLRVFRERIAATARTAFDRGAASLAGGDYAEAERSFKTALQVDGDSAPALAYLAATYAASGHDVEATSAWQTSLIDGSDFPQIYEWLGDTLLRNRQLTEARGVLEEAVQKWPADQRFLMPLALVYASFGQGREAVRMLERHVANHGDDHAAQILGVEWIYHLHSAGATANSPAEDLKLARGWADGYIKAKGPQAALVRQWIQFIESSSR